MGFNPNTDTLLSSDGTPFKFAPPSGQELPSKGFDTGKTGYLAPIGKSFRNFNFVIF